MRALIPVPCHHSIRRRLAAVTLALCATIVTPRAAAASDQVCFAAINDCTATLVQAINAETVRLDVGIWLLSEHSISIAIANRWAAGVPVRLIGDRVSNFESDPHTKAEFYWLASQGIPIRLRYNPTWFPEIIHWKTAIMVGQNKVFFGSGNFTPTELTPVNSTNYDDESFLLTDDPSLVNGFKTKFDVMWHDTANEPSNYVSAPYLKNWDDACALESACADYKTQYPNAVPMHVDTSRLEPDNPLPADMVWGQGSQFNDRLVTEINNENAHIDLIEYRLTVPQIGAALINRFKAGVAVRLIVDTFQYANPLWPEYELTHAYVDQLYAAGIPIRQRVHDGVTHMKTIVTSTYATNASSNYAKGWQRDNDYFVPAATKPTVYNALQDRFQTMWTDNTGFTAFSPQPPNAVTVNSPASGAGNVATNAPLVWNRAFFATRFDVYLGTSSSNMPLVGSVDAVLSETPPATYSFTPASTLAPGTTYFWKIVSKTFATPVNAAMTATSSTFSFTTAGSAGPPSAPTSPNPANGATGVANNANLTWTAAGATSYDVAFGTANPPATVSTGQANPTYSPIGMGNGTTYFWRITARNSSGSAAGPVWSFTTAATPPPPAPDIVIYASDFTAGNLHGAWTLASDATAAGGTKVVTPDNGVANTNTALAAPADYAEVTFNAPSATPYTIWIRVQAAANSKFNDSFYAQFSDAQSSGSPIYPLNSTQSLVVNLATDSGASSLSGWGWVNGSYWLSQAATVTFATTGTHTLRLQTREDGAQIDQIVLSPSTYFNANASCPVSCAGAPGGVNNDHTIVPKPGGGGSVPGVPGSPSPANGATNVAATPTLTWSAANATSYDVNFGTANPPPSATTGQSAASYAPSALANSTTYFWRIIAHNSAGTTSGPVWSFTTTAAPPPLPGTPGSPSPANGATNTGTTRTLTWSSTGATSYDVTFGTANPPPSATTGQSAASYAPSALANSTTYFWQIVAHNVSGATTGPVWSFTTTAAPPPPPGNIVIYASDVAAGSLHGSWTTASDATSPNSVKLVTPDNGVSNTSNALASPTDYVDVTFNANAGTAYTLWMRVQAAANSKFNDSFYVQFSDAQSSGSSIYPLNTTQSLVVNLATDSNATSINGWGWVNGSYWLSQPATVTFATSGTHTMRIQVREDGVQLDQIVLSPTTYFNANASCPTVCGGAPGPVGGDHTIVPK